MIGGMGTMDDAYLTTVPAVRQYLALNIHV